MPIIDHSDVRLAPVMERVRERYLVSKDQGAVSLTVKEVEISPGWEGRMHTHPVDVSIQVLSGAIQVILGDEVRDGTGGHHAVGPAGRATQADTPSLDPSGIVDYLPFSGTGDRPPGIARKSTGAS